MQNYGTISRIVCAYARDLFANTLTPSDIYEPKEASVNFGQIVINLDFFGQLNGTQMYF